MTEHSITLSTTEPNNYVGLLKMRQGDTNTQEIEATITANGQLFKFDNLSVFFNAVLPNGNVIRDKVTEVDYANSKLNYVVADSFLQEVAQVTAWFSFENGEKIIDSTKNFQYSVIPGWKECIPQGNYIYELSEIQREIEEIISNKDFTTLLSELDFLKTNIAYLDNNFKIIKADLYNSINEKLAAMRLNPEAFANEAALRAKYPQGNDQLNVTTDNGHLWIWIDGNFKDCGQFQTAGIDQALVDQIKEIFGKLNMLPELIEGQPIPDTEDTVITTTKYLGQEWLKMTSTGNTQYRGLRFWINNLDKISEMANYPVKINFNIQSSIDQTLGLDIRFYDINGQYMP
ncbi:BppU family phage baseplate upper protein, partial [Lactococcus cremoris]|uniref:BppU family phage baseplate upper protein n=1 Tax=Lactococcus lactis subsp. cremoris TaxID=1359 RepID=UPI0025A06C7B